MMGRSQGRPGVAPRYRKPGALRLGVERSGNRSATRDRAGTDVLSEKLGVAPRFPNRPALRASESSVPVTGVRREIGQVPMCCQRSWASHPGSRTARRFAPEIETPLRAVGALRRVPICLYLLVGGGVPPPTPTPRSGRQRTAFAAISFCAQSDAPTHRKGSAYGERRCSHRHRSRNAGETAHGRCTPSAAGQGNADLWPVLPVGPAPFPAGAKRATRTGPGGAAPRIPL